VMESDASSDGAFDDAADFGIPSPRKAERGRGNNERRMDGGDGVQKRGEKKSSRKGSSGSSGFANALKKMSLGSLGRYAEYQHRGSILPRRHVDEHGATRIETPSDGPGHRPWASHQDRLPPIPLSPESSSSSHDRTDSPDLDDYFTPPTIPTSMLHAHPSLPPHPTFPRVTARRDWQNLRSLPTPSSKVSEVQSNPKDGAAGFDLDIFSPRVSHAPVLRGIIDSLPVSPLELPSSRVSLMTLLDNRSYPSSALPTSPTSSPISNAEERTMPSLGQVASDWTKPTVTEPTPRNTPDSPARPSSSLYRLPRGSYPTSTSSPSIFPSSSYTNTLPFTRRHSAIIRPPILPSPTPPSLIMSPRSLGTPLIPPGPTSPSRLDTIAGLPPASLVAATVTLGRRVSDRNRRPSIAVRMGETRPTAGLGMGSMSGAGSGFRHKGPVESPTLARAESSKKRVPTPGTFGLEGEAEKRLVMEGDNPYFA
jgi:hypothetical protein